MFVKEFTSFSSTIDLLNEYAEPVSNAGLRAVPATLEVISAGSGVLRLGMGSGSSFDSEFTSVPAGFLLALGQDGFHKILTGTTVGRVRVVWTR